jgi:hypothetical protein
LPFTVIGLVIVEPNAGSNIEITSKFGLDCAGVVSVGLGSEVLVSIGIEVMLTFGSVLRESKLQAIEKPIRTNNIEKSRGAMICLLWHDLGLVAI